MMENQSDALKERDKRIAELEAMRHDEAKSFIADQAKLRPRIAELEAELIDERDRRHACEKYWNEMRERAERAEAERDELRKEKE